MASRNTPQSDKPTSAIASFSVDMGIGALEPRDAAFSLFSDVTGVSTISELNHVFLSDPGMPLDTDLSATALARTVSAINSGYLVESRHGDDRRLGLFKTLAGAFAQACVEIAMQREGTTRISQASADSNLSFSGINQAGLPVEIKLTPISVAANTDPVTNF